MPPYLKDLYNGKINGKTLVMPQVTRNLPNAGGSYQSPVVAPQSPGLFIGPQNKITPPAVVVPPAPTPLVGSFGGTAALPQKYDYNSGVVTPAQTGSYTPPANNLSGIPTKFINPKTGALYSVQEFVDNVANTMPQGDVPAFANAQFTEGPQSKEQLYATAGGLSSAKGDIETGATDPYKVATKSGINYSPSELAAIEKAYAGIYDPAINTALAKLDTKKKEEEAAIANKLELEKMAKQHEYDLALQRDKAGIDEDGVPGEFAGTVDLVSNMESSVYGKKAVKQQLTNLIANKDYPGAYAQIANSVENQLSGIEKTKYSNARTDYLLLEAFKNDIKKYAAARGDMGLIKGTEEEIKRKLGISSGKASAIAVELWAAFQKYRNDMTGAAFGAGESRDYAAVNPTLGKSLDLNLAVIDGARKALENQIISTVNSKVPSAKYILEYAEGAKPGSSETTKTGTDPEYEAYLKTINQ